jgi:hypothetical protein
MIIKSNSIILASDLSPAFQQPQDFLPYKKGLFPLGFVNNLAFEIQNNRTQSKQISSADFAVNNLPFSPTVSLSFDFTSSKAFQNENLLGIFFKPFGDYASCFGGSNNHSVNLFFIISDLFGLDLIQSIRDRGNLNGLEVLSFGNCALTNYGLSMEVNSLPAVSMQMEAVNMEAFTVSSDLMNLPAVNLSVGNKDNITQLKVDNTSFIANLNQLNTSVTGLPILPIYDSTVFKIGAENLQTPSVVLAPWGEAAISSINFSIAVERQNSYGFGSDFVYDRKIKFPILGDLSISAVSLNIHTGEATITGVMKNEESYDLSLQFIDPQELQYSGQSIATLSGLADQNYSGFLTNNKTLRINNAKLNSQSYSINYEGIFSTELSFSFACNEQNGLSMQWGQRSEKEGGQLFTSDLLRLRSSDGEDIGLNNYLYFKDEVSPVEPDLDASVALSADGYLLLTRDNTTN